MTEEYYKTKYTENSYWSRAKLNGDETARWISIKPLIESLQKDNLSIIDVGCGRGAFSNVISCYGDVIGIDPVNSVIEYGKELYPELELMALSLQDYVYIFPDKKYDLVLCTEVIEHVVDKVGFLKKLKNLLKDDGHIILTTPRKEIQEEWISKFGNPEQPIEEWISTEDLNNLIDQCGLKRLSYKTTYLLDIYQVHLLSV
jgi:2-polyprenyl-3-methyl-5-hydroxy-6-metoxy-1,4-benzoquinol methylase